MKIISIILVLLMICSTTAFAEDEKEQFSANDENILYTGRWVADEKDRMHGSFEGEIKVVFTGTSLGTKGTGAAYVAVDGGEPTAIELSNRSFVKGLEEGTHTAIISTAAQGVLPIVAAFYLDKGASLQKAEKTKQIEFIGDSILEGYVRSGENASVYTYGYHVARALGWDRSTVAYGGITLVEGYGNPDKTGMVNRYFKNKEYNADKDDATDWDTSKFVPDAIVINLGANDHNGKVTDAEYILAYTQFLTKLRAAYPDADIFVMNPFHNRMTEAITKLKEMNKLEKVKFIDSAFWEIDTAEDKLHLNQDGHRQAAQLLAEEIKAYYDGASSAPTSSPDDGGSGDTVAPTVDDVSKNTSNAVPIICSSVAGGAVCLGLVLFALKKKKSKQK